jgi:hypothetical protein
MILNAYAVLDGFLALLRLGLGLTLLLTAIFALCARPSFERRDALEARYYLLFLLAIVLLVLNVVSWPLFYLLLQSYVAEWPGVMCIYGVTQIGRGSVGISRYLPGLVQFVQACKPVLVLASGLWFVLYLLNRRTSTAPLTRRVLLILVVVGALGVADAAAEAAYLAIPKREETLAVGCCTGAFDGADRLSRFMPHAIFGERYRLWLHAGYYIINLSMMILLYARLNFFRDVQSGTALSFVLMLVSVVVSALFLIEFAAPALLRLPNHHCPYDLVSRAPEGVVIVGLFVLGTFAVGWASLATWFGSHAETETLLPRMVFKLLRLGLIGYVASALMMSVALFLVRPLPLRSASLLSQDSQSLCSCPSWPYKCAAIPARAARWMGRPLCRSIACASWMPPGSRTSSVASTAHRFGCGTRRKQRLPSS